MTPRTPQRADAGIHVLLISAMYPRPGDSVLGIVVRREVDALRARACTSEVIGKAPGWWGYAVQAREALRALRREYDVVHAHFGTSAFVAAAVRLGRRGRPPLVVTLHGSDVATGWRPQRDKYWLQFWLSYLGCLAARRVLVQDEVMLAALPGRSGAAQRSWARASTRPLCGGGPARPAPCAVPERPCATGEALFAGPGGRFPGEDRGSAAGLARPS